MPGPSPSLKWRQAGQSHLQFIDALHKFVILRSAATKDLRLLSAYFPQDDTGLASNPCRKAEKNTRGFFTSFRLNPMRTSVKGSSM